MKIQYLEIVTKEMDAVCAAYSSANGVQFGQPDAGLGNARTAKLAGGGEAAVAAVVQAGGTIAHPPLEIPGHGTFAIYLQGGNDHGLWQL